MKRFISTILVTALVLLVFNDAHAQTAADTARNKVLQLFQTYDSIPYITFDVKYTYKSDTTFSDYAVETMKGSYTMSGKKAKYSLGDVEYLQNDSFLIAVYHKDQMMVVSQPTVQNSGSYLPMRDMVDSLLQAYANDYDIVVDVKMDTIPSTVEDEIETKGFIQLTRKTGNTNAQFDRYRLEFDLDQNIITKLEYAFTEPGQGLTPAEEPDAGQRLLKNTARKRILQIEFSNYRFDNLSDTVYSENNWIWEEDGELKPVEQFKYYKVYNARN